MKRWFWTLIAVVLAGCVGTSTSTSPPTQPREVDNQPEQAGGNVVVLQEVVSPQVSIVLDNFGPAPELRNDVWLNTDGPLHLADLRGKVVLLDMWTFG